MAWVKISFASLRSLMLSMAYFERSFLSDVPWSERRNLAGIMAVRVPLSLRSSMDRSTNREDRSNWMP